jgi:membrane-bound metal-dependent hydrolase YbcI (DUF457 family)
VLFANVLAGLDTAAVGIFASLFQWTAEQLRALDGMALATFGFAVGVYGILVHLLADAITVAGVRPLLPLSQWRLSLSSIRADSPLANNGLLGLGILALAVVFLVTAPRRRDRRARAGRHRSGPVTERHQRLGGVREPDYQRLDR